MKDFDACLDYSKKFSNQLSVVTRDELKDIVSGCQKTVVKHTNKRFKSKES